MATNEELFYILDRFCCIGNWGISGWDLGWDKIYRRYLISYLNKVHGINPRLKLKEKCILLILQDRGVL